MKFSERLRLLFSSKESQARIMSSIHQVGIAQPTPANYETFAKQGYSKNVAVFTAVHKIATACSGIKWELFTKKGNGKPTEVTDSPLLTLWNNPNPMQGQGSFIEAVIAYYCITGNSYIEKNQPFKNKPPLELWPVRPDRMKIIPDNRGYPGKYQYTAAGGKKTWDVDPKTLRSDILHWSTFNPLNDWYGMSALEAAQVSMEMNNAGNIWNLSLLKNGASPSGVLQMVADKSNPRGSLTEEQYSRIKKEFSESYQGARNAGNPLLLEGGLNWQTISLSPKDMDFLKSKELSAGDIFLIFGVPLEMVGLGQKTFSNYKEARLAFYEETILPLMDSFRDEMNRDLTPLFGENLYLDYDRDDIEPLQYRREQKYTSLQTVNFLTQNEKRKEVGAEPVEGWDVFVIGNQVGALPEDFSGGGTDPNAEDENADPNAEEDETDEENDDENSEGDESDDDAADDSDKPKWKSINLVNQDEKRQSAKRQNVRRKRLAANFERDLAEELKDMEMSMVTAARAPGDAKLKEYAIIHAADAHFKQIRKTIAKHIKFALQDFGRPILNEGKSFSPIGETKANLKFDHFVESYAARQSGKAVTEVAGTTAKQVRKIVSEWTAEALKEGDSTVELADYLSMEMEGLSKSRAMLIARTETTAASTNGALEAVKTLQVPGMTKEWVTAKDSRVRNDPGEADHDAMDGVIVPVDEKFTVPPDASMDCPGDSAGGPSQVCNCRCVLTFKTNRKD
jgi:HK97 family phage portal protein